MALETMKASLILLPTRWVYNSGIFQKSSTVCLLRTKWGKVTLLKAKGVLVHEGGQIVRVRATGQRWRDAHEGRKK